jgi:Subtilase family
MLGFFLLRFVIRIRSALKGRGFSRVVIGDKENASIVAEGIFPCGYYSAFDAANRQTLRYVNRGRDDLCQRRARHDGQPHEPKLYGAITRESATRPEVTRPERPRIHCMAISSVNGTNRGRPSSWSAAIDQLAYGHNFQRLFVVSTGNIRQGISRASYPTLNDIEPVENPAQAWNALAVGAYTEKQQIVDPTFTGWAPIASVGGISPCSRTSVSWERKWPIKPDVVLEGGNHAHLGASVDTPDDLGLLSTHYRPLLRQFQAFGDTSAAAGLGARLSAQILADRPEAWMETVRSLVVHSAEWTPLMRAQLNAAANETQRIAAFRRFGYGVPNLSRAVRSSFNDATIVSENTLRPLQMIGGKVKSKDMHLRMLPWPQERLAELGDAQVELRVTLSYFIEPNPGERGWKGAIAMLLTAFDSR